MRQKRKGGTMEENDTIPTVEAYQNCNYRPATAFLDALAYCKREFREIESRLQDLSIHRAMWCDWENEAMWAIVQEYIDLANELQAINEKGKGPLPS